MLRYENQLASDSTHLLGYAKHILANDIFCCFWGGGGACLSLNEIWTYNLLDIKI